MKTTSNLIKFCILGAVLLQAAISDAQPVITQQPTNQMAVSGGNAAFSVMVTGVGPFTYQWRFNGTNLPNNIITTVAGNGIATYAGDNGAATNAGLCYPHGIALDDSGNLFIADTMNYRVRKIDTNGIISTVAGTNTAGYSGDGGAATNASLSRPIGVALDASGNLYIADGLDNCVRMVNASGIITTVAGTNGAGYSGDGGAATNASLYGPWGVTFDASGNLYIVENGNGRIRKVDTNGIITTVAGGGSGWDGSAAINASLVNPAALAFDSAGNFYITEDGTQRIRKVDTDGIITTVAGSGTNYVGSYSGDGGTATNANLQNPFGLAFDATGNLYIADELNNRIRMVNTNGIISTVVGNGNGVYSGDGGTATNASINWPFGVAVDSAGNLFIGDMQHQRIREVHFAGFPSISLNTVNITNSGNYTVVIASSYGSVTSSVATLTVAAPPVITGQPVSQIAAEGVSLGFSVAVIGSGPFGYEWYLAGTNLVQSGTNSTFTLPNVSTNDAGNYTVVITNYWGSVTSQVAILSLKLPPMVAIQPVSQTNLAGTTVSFNVTASTISAGPFTYQWQFNGTNLPNNIITTVAGNGTGNYAGDGGAATNASLNRPSGVTLDASGNLYIADSQNYRIRKIGTNGIITTVAGKGIAVSGGDGGTATNASFAIPGGVAFDASGNLYITELIGERIRMINTNGIITTVAGIGMPGKFAGDGGAATNGCLYDPICVAFDASGNMYIADSNNERIRKVATNGIITTVAGGGSGGDGGTATNAELYTPSGVALNASSNLYIADTFNNRLRKVDTNGIITTVAGTNAFGYSGDGGVATNARLHAPESVACDVAGNLYIADLGNNCIRRVDTNGIINTVAGNGTATFGGDGGAATNAGVNPYALAFDASGNLYIVDQQHNRIREVHFAGFPSFSLTNANVTSAGNYSVVITSPYGSVTSAVVSLTVTIPNTPPQIMVSDGSFGFTTNQSGFGFNVNGPVSQAIVVDGSTNLINWIPLFTNIVGSSSPFYFFDPVWTNFPMRFYRARLQ